VGLGNDFYLFGDSDLWSLLDGDKGCVPFVLTRFLVLHDVSRARGCMVN
jgi:hypothetical protein